MRGCVGGFVLVWVALAAAQPRAIWSGFYTAAQADAGEQVYFDRCVTCHGDDLGGVERAPALAVSTADGAELLAYAVP